jgi:hypothetical protein
MNDHTPDMFRGAIAGVLGGIAGTLAMDAVSAAWTLGRRGHLDSREATLVQQGGRPDVEDAKQRGRDSGEPEAVATSAVAERAARPLLGRPMSPRERHEGGRLVHYAFGALLGGIYGAVAERFPSLGTGLGVPFGLSVWVGGVEAALPLLRLSDPPTSYSPAEHAFGAVSHAAYGLTADLVRRRAAQALSQ